MTEQGEDTPARAWCDHGGWRSPPASAVLWNRISSSAPPMTRLKAGPAAGEMAEPRDCMPRASRRRQHAAQQHHAICSVKRLLVLQQVVAARIERAAERADRAVIGRAKGHVLALEVVLADAAAQLDALAVPVRLRLARDVVSARCPRRSAGAATKATNRPMNGARACAAVPKQAEEGAGRADDRDRHRTDADRIDVVEVRALELDAARAEAQRLVDDEVAPPARRSRRRRSWSRARGSSRSPRRCRVPSASAPAGR